MRWLLLLICCLVFADANSAEVDFKREDPAVLLSTAKQNLLAGDYAEAVYNLNSILLVANDEEAQSLIVEAHALAGSATKAKAEALYFIRTYPNSRFIDKVTKTLSDIESTLPDTTPKNFKSNVVKEVDTLEYDGFHSAYLVSDRASTVYNSLALNATRRKDEHTFKATFSFNLVGDELDTKLANVAYNNKLTDLSVRVGRQNPSNGILNKFEGVSVTKTLGNLVLGSSASLESDLAASVAYQTDLLGYYAAVNLPKRTYIADIQYSKGSDVAHVSFGTGFLFGQATKKFSEEYKLHVFADRRKIGDNISASNISVGVSKMIEKSVGYIDIQKHTLSDSVNVSSDVGINARFYLDTRGMNVTLCAGGSSNGSSYLSETLFRKMDGLNFELSHRATKSRRSKVLNSLTAKVTGQLSGSLASEASATLYSGGLSSYIGIRKSF